MTTSPEVPTAAPTARPLRVLHFVSGGFSGATQVAIDLCGEQPGQQTLLVLRRRASVDPAPRVRTLRESGLLVEVVPRWSHAVTIRALARICPSTCCATTASGRRQRRATCSTTWR